MPEITGSHIGKNIAAHIFKVLQAFKIKHKIGYFTLDNVSNNDTAMEELGKLFNINDPKRCVYCFGYIANLAVSTLLFGKDIVLFKDLLGLD